MKSCRCRFNKFSRTSSHLWLQYHRRPQSGTMEPSARSTPCLCPSPLIRAIQSTSTEPAWTTGTSSCGCSKVIRADKDKKGAAAHCSPAEDADRGESCQKEIKMFFCGRSQIQQTAVTSSTFWALPPSCPDWGHTPSYLRCLEWFQRSRPL